MNKKNEQSAKDVPQSALAGLTEVEMELLLSRVMKHVDERFDAQLAKSKEWLETTLGWSSKILAVAVVLLLGGFAFMGVQKLDDIPKQVEEKVNEKFKQSEDKMAERVRKSEEALDAVPKQLTEAINKKLELVQPEPKFREQLKTLADDAQMQNLMVQIAALPYGKTRDLDVAPGDEARIFALMMKPERTADQFSAALKVWSRVLQSGLSGSRVEGAQRPKTLMLALMATDSAHVEAATKLRILLETAWERGFNLAVPDVRTLAKDPEQDPGVRYAALQYLAEREDSEAAKLLTAALSEGKPTERAKYTELLARVDPKAPAVQDWTSEFLKKEVDEINLSDCVSAIKVTLAARRIRWRGAVLGKGLGKDDPRAITATALLEKLIQVPIVFSINEFREDMPGEEIAMKLLRGEQGRYSTLSQNQYDRLMYLLSEVGDSKLKAGNLKEMAKVVKLMALNFDMEGEVLGRYAQLAAVHFRKEGSEVELGDGTKLDPNLLSGPLLLMPGERDGQILALWLDQIGVLRNGELAKLVGGKDAKMTVKAIVRLDYSYDE